MAIASLLRVFRPLRPLASLALLAVGFGAAGGAAAQSVPGQGLTNPQVFDRFNALERAAAQANQATFNTLLPLCGLAQQTAQCTPQVFRVFEEARALVHTANELAGTGPTEFSLGLDQQGLGFALRWTAAEEMAAQGSATTRFAASQLGSLAARITSLRWGVSGPRAAYLQAPGDPAIRVADGGALGGWGGGASGDESLASPLSWFLDGSFGYGSKDPTDLEDAFDFDGQEVTTGIDYRWSPALVFGGMLGYTSKEVDFDSSQSIVDGGIETDGLSLMAYGLWEGQNAYVSGSLGYQQLTHDSRRRITYPSQNPLIPGTNSLATSSTDSNAILISAGAGYALRWNSFSIEPALDLTYTDASVDAFTERSIDLDSNEPDDPFGLRIGSQSIESLDAALGIRADYVFTPSFGVVVPYLTARYHREMLDDVRRISARYANAFELLLQGIAGDPNFNVPTDDPDDDYYTLGAGLTIVLQGGLMGFVQYLEVLDLDNYSDSVITGGVRYEFGR